RGVRGEAGGGRDRIVGRVEIDEIARLGARHRLLERRVLEIDPEKGVAGGDQRSRIGEARVLVPAEGDVETAGAVDAPETVEAGLVEVDEAGGALGGREAR